jgi:Cupin domain
VDEHRRRSIVGSIDERAQARGWFFGQFMDEPLLRSDLVEVAWQRIPGITPSAGQRHLHRRSVEINVVVGGSVRLRIDDVEHDLRRGDFYVVWPESVVSDIETDADAEVIVVRAPSIAGDKFPLTAD